MKKIKILTTLMSLMLFCFCSAQKIEVAKINSEGKIEFTEGFEKVKENFSKVLKEQKNNAILTNFEIKNEISEAGKSYYHIIATNNDNTVKTAHILNLKERSFIFDFKDGTTTCTGCTRGCNPKLDTDGYYYCIDCTQGSGCTKSTTVITHYP